MNREEAIKVLKLHGDFGKESSYLYAIKENNIVSLNLFHEIMNSLIALSEKTIEKEQIEAIYGIIFWCRGWIDSGWIENKIGTSEKEKLKIHVGILENALYYLLKEDVEEAFWAYNEFLDGRYR